MKPLRMQPRAVRWAVYAFIGAIATYVVLIVGVVLAFLMTPGPVL